MTLTALVVSTALGATGMVPVGPGDYRPLYAPDPDHPVVHVEPFLLDVTPVTRAQLATFVTAHPQWRRDRVSATFAEPAYLADWTDPLTPDGAPQMPAVQVSWFAARAYCASLDRRLPTEDEWEVAALADATHIDASGDPERTATILSWYGSADATRSVGLRPANAWGVHDLHGLVWEWVEDFNQTLYGADPREAGGGPKVRFCGAGALSAADARDYATFMRVSFRTSLQANYTAKHLGFRCAKDLSARQP